MSETAETSPIQGQTPTRSIEIPKPADIQNRLNEIQVEAKHLKKLLKLAEEVWGKSEVATIE